MKYQKYLDEKIVDLSAEVVAVTGATSGIGLAAALELVYKGAHVILVGRNVQRLEKTKEEMLKDFPQARLDVLLWDQESLSCTKDFAVELRALYPNLTGVVLNAGIFRPKKGSMSADGYPLTLAVNAIAPFYFMELMKGFFEKLNRVKVVFVGSVEKHKIKDKHRYCYLKEHVCSSWKQYQYSKMAIAAIGQYYADHHGDEKHRYYIFHPGVAATKIFHSKSPNPLKRLWNVTSTAATRIIFSQKEKMSLGILKIFSDDLANGTYVVPRGWLQVWGYPRVKNTPEDIKKESLIIYGELNRLMQERKA